MPRRRARWTKWREFRGALRPTGAVIAGLGVTQALCALAGAGWDLWSRSQERLYLPASAGWLLLSAAIAVVFGIAIALYGGRFAASSLGRREAVLAVALIWVAAGIFGGLPFVIGAAMTPVDAFFEAVSGLTTTGATVITQIESRLPPGAAPGDPETGGLSTPILLWRSLIQWLGGMGIVVLFVAVFPSLGAGAKHMFKGEVPGTSAEGLKPRIAETSFTLWKLYAAITGVEAVLLFACGMNPFEAVCHAFTTMSTGGFSTRDASVAGFDSPAIEVVIATFMILGSFNYGLYYALLRGRSLRSVLRNTELRVFLIVVAALTLILAVGILGHHGHDPLRALRYAYFMVGTTLSSTGYGTDDYMAYPAPMLGLVILMMFMGGCSGSTAGGVKVERFVLMAKLSWAEFRKSFRPAVVHVVKMGRTAVPQDILIDVAVFVGVFMACLGFGILFVCATDDVSVPTAFGATLSCLSNMGPAPFYNQADNFAMYSDAAKLFFVLAMLLGRLEFFTLFALLVPDFWRR